MEDSPLKTMSYATLTCCAKSEIPTKMANETTTRSSICSGASTHADYRNGSEKLNIIDLEKGSYVSEEVKSKSYAEVDNSVAIIISRSLSGTDDLIAEANKTDEPLPQMGTGRDLPPPVGDSSIYLVDFDGPEDATHPYNWSLRRKISGCVAVVFSALVVSMGSAMFAEGFEEIEEIYHVSETVVTLGTSLFVFGFASGPIIWGPLSELYGRKNVMIPSALTYTCFCFAVATSKDIQSIMICRFFAGFMGAAPLVAAPAALGDLFNNKKRGAALAIFAMMLFGGPMLAPIIGGFIVKNLHMGWRWTSYLTGILAGLSLILTIFLYEETHHPIILARKAEILRRRTGNWAIHAAQEEISLNFKEIVENNLTRPISMLFTEPIIFFISLYNAFIYGILYLCLTAIPLIFIGEYRFTQGVAELPYLAMFIGVFIGGFIMYLGNKRYLRIMEENGGEPVPEERLPPMMIGGFFFAGGLFWLCWAGDYADKVHWIVPTLGAGCIGIGLITIFLPCISYIIDCYILHSASALAANTLLRSSFGAAFPLFAMQMFVNMKIKWAGTLLGCIGIVLIPVPFLFYKYGSRIRSKSRYLLAL